MTVDIVKPEKLVVRTTYEVKLRGSHIIDMLNEQCHSIPHSASVTLNIPMGGDYSGMSLDVNGHTPVTVRWEEGS